MKTEIKQNYMEIIFEKEDELVDFECEMLLNNEIEGVLSVTRKIYNGKPVFMYDTKGKISLRRLGEGKEFSLEEFLLIACSLLRTINGLREYSLYSDGVILDKDSIFIDPRSMQCGIIYLPNARREKNISELQLFFKEFLFSGMVRFTDGTANEVVRILNAEYQSITELRRSLERLQNNPPVQAKQPVMPKAVPNPRPQKVQEEVVFEERKETAAEKVSLREEPSERKNWKPGKKGEKKEKDKDKEKDKNKKNRSGTVMLLVTGILLVGFAFLFNAGFFAGKNGKLDTSMLAGAFVAILGIDFLIYRKIKAKKENSAALSEEKPRKEKKIKEKKKKEKKTNPKQAPEKMKYRKMKSAPVREEQVFEEKKEEIATPVREVSYREKMPQKEEYLPQENISVAESDVTEYMDAVSANAGGEKTGYLENAMGERFYLTQEHTRIGSQAGKADIVLQNRKISRLHAEIYRRDGMYYLMDMNSSNGTYLNHASEPLTPCVEYSLTSGDSVRFANAEYIFRVVC